MSEDLRESYHTALNASVDYTLREYGPMTISELLETMKEEEIAYQQLMNTKHEMKIGIVQQILQYGDSFTRDDSGRWHLTG